MLRVSLLFSAVILSACATSHGQFQHYDQQYPALAADAAVEVYEQAPSRAYARVARLDAHYEKTGMITTSRKTAIEELKRQARRAGATGIINIDERRTRILETQVYHVSAVGIRFK